MDGEKFDKIAKVLSNDTTRRGVLGGLAGILASVVGTSSTEARKRAQGGKKGGGKPDKCRKEGHPCEGNQKCCPGLKCRVTGPGNAERCAKPVCPPAKCNCSTCKCKKGDDCATGCCKDGYCCPKDKCAPPPECPTTCPKDFCGDLKVPKGCPPVTCKCPKGYECKDYKCVPVKCPTACPTDYCGEFEVPKGCPPVKCPKCPDGYECKNYKCVKKCPTACPTDYCGEFEVPKGCPPVKCPKCPDGYECKNYKCVKKDFCGHSVGTNGGCKGACTSQGEGCGGSCEDICSKACPVGSEDRECTSTKYCEPKTFTCVKEGKKCVCTA
jgi:hypothetical protein